MIINYVLVIGCLLDLILTYNYLRLYKIKFPKKDYAIIEANPLIRYLIRRFKLMDGMIISGMIILTVVMILINLVNINTKFFLAGAYYMMITFHLTNLLAFSRIKNINNNDKGGNRNGKRKNRRS